MEPVSVNLEFTPNPNTLKFVVNRPLLEKGAVNFTAVSAAEKAPLALKLFAIPGVEAVMIGTNFVTITKAPNGDWDILADRVPATLDAHLTASLPILAEDFVHEAPPVGTGTAIEQRIREVLDTDIRPAVAMDGGDITFNRFEDGIVYLELRGACSSCAHSVATLKMGVETRLKEAVPEIREVVQV